MGVKLTSLDAVSAPSLARIVAFIFFFILATLSNPFSSQAAPATFAVGPDSNQELLVSVLLSAKRNLWINVYQFDHPQIRKALLQQIRAGVAVRLLLEGEPLGNISDEGLRTIEAVCSAMEERPKAGHQLWVMTSKGGKQKRRYRYDHAKYVIIDQEGVLVSSENFTGSGHTNPGFVGNRGWDVSLRDRRLAKQLAELFQTDTSPTSGDVMELSQSGCRIPGAASRRRLNATAMEMMSAKGRHAETIGAESGEVRNVELITSPDSLGELVSLIRSAKDRLDTEQMTLSSMWREAGKSKVSPLLSALVERARDGVRTRVLLNDDAVFHAEEQPPHNSEDAGNEDSRGNRKTVLFLNQVARCENLPLEAKIVDTAQVEITYIHNKGILVDGERALVSSINGTQNAVMNNREVGLILDSTDAARYYGRAFDFDWSNSAPMKSGPCQLRVFDHFSQ